MHMGIIVNTYKFYNVEISYNHNYQLIFFIPDGLIIALFTI